MYTKMKFGQQLKEKIGRREDVERIGAWAHTMYMEHICDIDLDFRSILLTLNTMELGYEFYFTYEELDQIADDLIAGKEVVFHSNTKSNNHGIQENKLNVGATNNDKYLGNDCCQFTKMLNLLSACRQRQIGSDELLLQANSLISNLQECGDEYKNKLQEYWTECAIEYAFYGVSDRQHLSNEEIEQFNNAINEVEKIIKEKITSEQSCFHKNDKNA